MSAPQRIARVRRQYNQWVVNQMLEDYALRFTPNSARRWSPAQVRDTALGAGSFLALEAIGGAITLEHGFTDAVSAILVVSLLILGLAAPITHYAAKYGVDIDLLTRGAGFGYIGSTLTSLIYASFTFIFFALEATILAAALHLLFGLPIPLGYLVTSLGIIPLVTHGITFISRFQRWTQPVWLVLQILPLAYLLIARPETVAQWVAYAGAHGGGLSAAGFGAAAAVVFSLAAQIGEQVDFLRFMPAETAENRREWWFSLLAGGPGWAVPGCLKLLAGSFLAVLAVNAGLSIHDAGQPAQMYLRVFTEVSPVPALAVLATGLFVLVAQVKINVTNAYAGSIAWSNFFSRLTHSHPGRVVWLVFNVCVSLLLMGFGVYEGLEGILSLFAVIAVGWLGTVFTDLVICKPLGFSPPGIEFHRAHLYDVNPVGLAGMASALLAAAALRFGLLGEVAQSFTVFGALAAPLIAVPLTAKLTGGRFYLARAPEPKAKEKVTCAVCEHEYEPEDIAHCPAYGGHICSLCCSLDARCNDQCKAHARVSDQLRGFLSWAGLPAWIRARVFSPVGTFAAVMGMSLMVIGAVLIAIRLQAGLRYPDATKALDQACLVAFAAMAVIIGVASWLLILARESRTVAEEESQRQTALLMDEIEAHRRTDAELQRAKEAAEAANQAKTRYVVGISHELRSPLNAIFGYVQLLEGDADFPPRRREALRVIRRGSEHLSGLIEGLLDISKIESGRMRLDISDVRLVEFLEQIVGMFELQARAKGLTFTFNAPDALPVAVRTDESRLRQILINLLSNALKFTDRGGITLGLRYRSSQIAEFEVIDTGVGIPAEDLDRVFHPFERGRRGASAGGPGLGLGLTITKMLTEILGGEIIVTSEVGKGSRFLVRLMLSEVRGGGLAQTIHASIVGYAGRRLTILAADDDPSHLSLVREALEPLGFIVITASDGDEAIKLALRREPEIVLLDIMMPGPGGWEVARSLRERLPGDTVIMMVSGNVHEAPARPHPGDPQDDFVTKPVNLQELLNKIARHAGVRWITADESSPITLAPSKPALPRGRLEEAARLLDIGHARGARDVLDRLVREHKGIETALRPAREALETFDLKAGAAALARLLEDAAE